MSDTQAAMREFRFLDDKRKTNGLTPTEEHRWQELAASLGVDLAAVQPAGYYGENGQWYAYPAEYDPNAAAWGYPQPGYGYPPPGYPLQPQGYYGPDGQWYPYPLGYDPSAAPWGYPPPGYGYLPPGGYPPPGYDPNQWAAWQAQQQAQGSALQGGEWDAQQQPADSNAWREGAENVGLPAEAPAALKPTPAPPAPFSPTIAGSSAPGFSVTHSQTAAPGFGPANPLPVPFDAPAPAAPPAPLPPPPPMAAPSPLPPAWSSSGFSAPEVSSAEVMEVTDDEVVEIPAVTAPPATAAPAPAPAPRPLTPPSSVEEVADLRNALSLDDDLDLGKDAAPEPAPPKPAAAPPAPSPVADQVAAATEPELQLPVVDATHEVLSSTSTITQIEVAAVSAIESGGVVEDDVPSVPLLEMPAIAEPEPTPVAKAPVSVVQPEPAAEPSVEVALDAQQKASPVLVERPAADAAKVSPITAEVPSATESAPTVEQPSVFVAEDLSATPTMPELAAPDLEPTVEAPSEPPMKLAASSAPTVETLPELTADPVPVVAVVEPLAAGEARPPIEFSALVEPPAPVEALPTVGEALPTLGDVSVVEPPPAVEALPTVEDVAVVEPPGEASPVETLAAEPAAARVSGSLEVSPALEQPPLPESDLVVTAELEPVVERSQASAQVLVPALDDLAVVEAEPSEPSPPAGFAPSLDDLPPARTETAGPPSAPGGLAHAPEDAPLPQQAASTSPSGSSWENAPALEPTARDTSVFGGDWSAEPEIPEASEDSPIVIASNRDVLPATKPTAPERQGDVVFASNWDVAPAPIPHETSAPLPDEWAEKPPASALPQASPADKVELASAAEFISWDQAPVVSEEEALPAATAEDFVIESGTTAELANDMRPSQPGASTVDDAKLELASGADFLQHPQLTQTGEAWQPDGRGIELHQDVELEAEIEGEIIQGTVVEEEPIAEAADAWSTAVSQPSAAPWEMAVPPLSAPPVAPSPRPQSPPVAAPVTAQPPLQVRVATPVGASPAPGTGSHPAMPPPLAASAVPGTGGHRAMAMPPAFGESPPPPTRPGAPAPSGAAHFDRSGAMLSGESPAVPVAGEHRVILHTLEGQVKRGAIRDADLCGPALVLELPAGGTEIVPRDRIKALFFMLTPGRRPPTAEGTKVRVTFMDGRQVTGFSKDHRSAQAGFFIVPADNRTNTERIFIYRHGLQSVVPE
jgi:hypothetical protein